MPLKDTIWSAEAGHAGDPLIVLVHGAMDRSASMLKLSRRLDHQYRVLRYDRRGYGHSVAHPGPFGMAHQVADLIALLAGRRAVLIGHSYGGNVALAAAAAQGDLVGIGRIHTKGNLAVVHDRRLECVVGRRRRKASLLKLRCVRLGHLNHSHCGPIGRRSYVI